MIVDTDVLIRYLTDDDLSKAKRFENYLQSGKKLTLTDVTFAETYWTLNSFYKFPRKQIIAVLGALIEHKSISSNKKILSQLLDILKKHTLSFIDAYTVAYSLEEDEGKILSYDKGFDKLKAVHRSEP